MRKKVKSFFGYCNEQCLFVGEMFVGCSRCNAGRTRGIAQSKRLRATFPHASQPNRDQGPAEIAVMVTVLED